MTTVLACRSTGVMVSDSRVGHKEGQFTSTKKVQRVGNYLVGVAGDYDDALIFVRRLARRLRGRDGSTVPEMSAGTGEFEVVVMSRQGLWLYGQQGAPIEVEAEDYYAIGSGASRALASLRTQELLLHPADLELAVTVACEYDTSSGPPLVVVKLDDSSV